MSAQPGGTRRSVGSLLPGAAAGILAGASSAAVQLWRGSARAAARVPVAGERVVRQAFTAVLDRVLDRVLPEVLARLESGAERSQLVELVESLVAEVVPPTVEQALPEAIDRLTADPEPLRELVWGQGTGMADELATRVQDVARHADERVDRMARRMGLRR